MLLVVIFTWFYYYPTRQRVPLGLCTDESHRMHVSLTSNQPVAAGSFRWVLLIVGPDPLSHLPSLLGCPHIGIVTSRMAHTVPPIFLTARLPWPSTHRGSDILSPIDFSLGVVSNPSYYHIFYFQLEARSALCHSCSISFAGGGLGHHSSCLFVFSIDFFLGSRLISSACTTPFFS